MNINYKKIYKSIFEDKNYNTDHSISYIQAKKFLEAQDLNTILNVGSGRGHLEKLLVNSNYCISSCDLSNVMDSDYGSIFFEIDLSDKSSLSSLPFCDALICLDVLEHLEENLLQGVIQKFSEVSNRAFFTIANHSDIINGVELHLTQKPEPFWTHLIGQFFRIISCDSFYDNRLLAYTLISK